MIPWISARADPFNLTTLACVLCSLDSRSKSKIYQSFWEINTILPTSVVKGSELKPP